MADCIVADARCCAADERRPGGGGGGITHLADMLGVTRQSAERLLNDFEVAKILDNQRGAVTIKDRSKLHDRACACSRMLAKRLRALFV